MKKLFLIFLIALSTCVVIKERFDGKATLKISKEKTITSSKTRHTPIVVRGVATRLIPKIKGTRNLPTKRINDIFKGKSREEFRNQKNMFKSRDNSLKKRNTPFSGQVPKIHKFCGAKNPGQHYEYLKFEKNFFNVSSTL